MANEKLTKAEVAALKAEKKASKAASKKKKEKSHKVAGFFSGLKSELKKVTWYSRSATLRDSAFVAVVLVILALVIGLVDAGLGAVVTWLGGLLY